MVERLTEQQIAAELEIAPSTAHYWISRYHSGDASLSSRPKTGRPKKLDATLEDAIFEASREDPFLPATQIRRDLLLANRVCVQTVRNRLRARGLRCRRPARKDYLKREHRDKRYDFALAHMPWTADRWKRVIFSDEKIFSLGGNGPPNVWRPIAAPDRLDPRYVASTRNTEWGRLTIMVWACISSEGNRNRIHLIDPPRDRKRTLNSEYYVNEILDKVVLSDVLRNDARRNEIIFMHDNSPIHTAHRTRKWIRRNRLKVMKNWPPKGPDMNPIENVWAEIERQLARRQCRDRHELWMYVSQTFETLTTDDNNGEPSDYLKNLINSMPRRMAEVVQRDGGWTRY